MRAGTMRHRVTVQNFTSKRLPSGQVQQVWSDVATFWAEVKGVSGQEVIASGAEKSEVTFRMWIRYRPDVTSASRILWQQKGQTRQAYAVVSALPDDKSTRLELLCKGGVKP